LSLQGEDKIGTFVAGGIMKTTKELLGARIKELRKVRNMSQEELAEMIGVEPRHMSRIEVGKSYPTLDRLERIANALNVPIKDFFDFLHLQESDKRAQDIEKMVKELGEDYQKIAHRIVTMLKDM
jgi:transcriptional regulator with XRE-family HTH domain